MKELTISSAGLSINILSFRNIPILEKLNIGSTYNIENIFFENLPILKKFSIDAISSINYLDLSDLPMLESIGFGSCSVEKLNIKNGKIVTAVYLDSSLKQLCVDENEITHYQNLHIGVEVKSDCTILGIGDFDFNNELGLYPNPVQNRLHITSKNDLQIQSLEIYNLQGQMLQSAPQVNKMSFDVNHLPKGTYVVKLKTDRGESTSKFVKE